MIMAVSDLPFIYFPDELRKDIPLVKRTLEKYIIEYPSQRARTMSVPNGARIITSFRGDGVTRTYKVPYLGQGIES